MPIKHAALREIRRDRKRHQRNQAVRTELKTLTKQLAGLVHEQKVDEARKLLQRLTSQLDRAVSKGIVHPNTAARSKSRLAHQVAKRPPAT